VVRPGDIVFAKVDRALLNDITGPLAFTQLKAMGVDKLRHKEIVVLVGDHFAPPKDVPAAEGLRSLSLFAKQHSILHDYGVGDGGIEHTLLPERGLVRPGNLIVGGDSHTCTYGAFGALGTGMGSTDIAGAIALGELWFMVPETMRFEFFGEKPSLVTGKDIILNVLRDITTDGATYRCMEFGGSAVATLSMDERMAICNMAVEGGAKTCIVPADEVTRAWAAQTFDGTYEAVTSDAAAEYVDVRRYDLSRLEPLCAQPFSPDNVAPVRDVKGVGIDQAYIGNCANGTITDLRQAASVLKGRKVAKGVRCVVVPATQRIYRQAMREGLIETFLDANVVVSPPTCGACAGLHNGVLAPGQVAVATTNRNYRGRMGHADSKVFLANAYVAAASAVAGELVDPREVLQ
jgi:3-isopropylmalate/(R)-2-methylmalate dehydratase large subunit